MSDATVISAPSAPPGASHQVPAHAFRPFQTRNLASWVFFVCLIAGAVTTTRYFRPGLAGVGTATLWGFVGFGLYALPWLWFLRRIDRWTRLPAQLVLSAFLWGGLAATFLIAVTANDALISIYGKTVSEAFAQDWGAALAAPLDEELAKGIGVVLLMTMAPRLVRLPFDGLIVGAFVGLGFQILEDVSYVISGAVQGFGANQVGAFAEIMVLRGVTGLVSHTFYSALFGAGIVCLVETSIAPARRLRGLALMLLAMGLHGVWDCAGELGEHLGMGSFGPIAVMLAVSVILIAAFVVVLIQESRAERALARELLAPEVARGTMTEAELTALTGTRKQRRQYLRSTPGRRDWRARGHVLEAATDLATALSIAGGTETLAVGVARAELTRIRAAQPQLAQT